MPARNVSGPSYIRLSLAAKQAQHRDRMREPAVACPMCETQTTVADLARHIDETCRGRREPHPLSEWISWREALSLGVLRGTLCKWIKAGRVSRREDGDGQHVYLKREIVLEIAARRRRVSKGKPFPPGKGV